MLLSLPQAATQELIRLSLSPQKAKDATLKCIKDKINILKDVLLQLKLDVDVLVSPTKEIEVSLLLLSSISDYTRCSHCTYEQGI